LWLFLASTLGRLSLFLEKESVIYEKGGKVLNKYWKAKVCES
jgi:hypothetical protein